MMPVAKFPRFWQVARGLILVGAILGGSPPAQGQGLFGLGSGDVSLPAEVSPREALLDELSQRESDFESRVDAFQTRYGWRLERLAERSAALEVELQALGAQRAELDPLEDAQTRRTVSEAILRTRVLFQRIRQVQEVYDAHLSSLTDGASLARQLGLQLRAQAEEGEAVRMTVAEISGRLTQLDSQIEALATRRTELRGDRGELETSLAGTRDALDRARAEMLGDELSESRRQMASDAAVERGATHAEHVASRTRAIAGPLAEQRAEAQRRWLRGWAQESVRRVALAGWAAILMPDPSLWSALVAGPFETHLAERPRLARSGFQQAVSRAQVVLRRAYTAALPEVDDRRASDQQLARELRQLDVLLLERQRELERERIELVNLELEKVSIRWPVLSFQSELLGEQRDEAAAREAGGIWSREPTHFDRAAVAELVARTRQLAADPGVAWRSAKDYLSARRGPTPAVASLVLVLLLAIAGYPLFRGMRRLAARVGETVPWPPYVKSLRLLAFVLPPCVLLAASLLLSALPPGLVETAWILVLAPPAFIGVGLLGRVLYPWGGTDRFTPRTARGMRGLLWAASVVTTGLVVATAVMPIVGYSARAERPVRGLAVVVALLGFAVAFGPRRNVLERLGLGGADRSLLLRGIQRLYPIGVLGVVAVGVVHLAGYHELAQVGLRRGLIVGVALLLVPWAHGRLHRRARALIGYPDGRGRFVSGPEASVRLYRIAAPFLTLLVGSVGLLIVASSWGLEGSMFGNVEALSLYPLLSFGDTAISLWSLFLFALTVAGMIAATRWLLPQLRERVYPIYDLSPGLRAALDTLVRYLLFLVGLVIGLQVIGLGLGFLAIFAGVIGVAVGFGSQTLAANFMSGLILQFSRPVNVGDFIEVEGVVGRIQRISSYATVVRSFENVSVIVPNSVLIGQRVVNWSEGQNWRRFSVNVGVAYGSDLALATRLLREVAERHEKVLGWPKPGVKFQEFGDSSLNLTLEVWIAEMEAVFGIASDLRYAIDAAFREHGIEIPFPQRDLHLRSSDAVVSLARAKGWDVRLPDGSAVPEGSASGPA